MEVVDQEHPKLGKQVGQGTLDDAGGPGNQLCRFETVGSGPGNHPLIFGHECPRPTPFGPVVNLTPPDEIVGGVAVFDDASHQFSQFGAKRFRLVDDRVKPSGKG